VIFTLDIAMDIAYRAHEGQLRDGGKPYITHVNRVVLACAKHGTDAQIVAALHDVVEDSDTTLDDLIEAGAPFHIVAAVDAISRRECSACKGYGRVLAKDTWLGAHARLTEQLGHLFLPGTVAQFVDLALQDIRDEKCSSCGGGNERLESREDYLARVKTNELATLVKIEDARDNRDDDGRPGMELRYKWVLEQLGVEE
jgi:hypothetical protein